MKIDIQEIITAKINDLEQSGTIQKTIEDGIEKTVLGAITGALGDYKIKHDLEKKVEEQVSKIVADIGFTAYNSFIAEKVRDITEGVCNKDIADKIQKVFNDILIVKRESVKLSEICEKYREWICEATDGSEKYERRNFHVSIEEHREYGWLTVKFAKEKADRFGHIGRDGSIEFIVHRNHGDKGNGSIAGVVIDGVRMDEQIKFGYLSDIALLVLNISYNKTPIIIDVENEDDVDNSYDIDD